MKDDPQNSMPEDELRAENEVLRLKLELDHGMKQSDTSALSPEVENQWLKNIYDFEQQYRNARRVKVYDAIGRPHVRKLEELSPEEVSGALNQLLSLMEENGIELDCCCAYDDATIYRFITEELFEVETDDISVGGMMQHFIYEEFHPNHDYDLRRYAKEFTEHLLERKWDPQFDAHSLSSMVSYKGKEYNSEEISSIIVAFQEDRTFQIEKFDIDQASFDVEKGEGKVQARVAYYSRAIQGNQLHYGDVTIHFTYQHGYWYISGFRLPGFGD